MLLERGHFLYRQKARAGHIRCETMLLVNRTAINSVAEAHWRIQRRSNDLQIRYSVSGHCMNVLASTKFWKSINGEELSGRTRRKTAVIIGNLTYLLYRSKRLRGRQPWRCLRKRPSPRLRSGKNTEGLWRRPSIHMILLMEMVHESFSA